MHRWLCAWLSGTHRLVCLIRCKLRFDLAAWLWIMLVVKVRLLLLMLLLAQQFKHGWGWHGVTQVIRVRAVWRRSLEVFWNTSHSLGAWELSGHSWVLLRHKHHHLVHLWRNKGLLSFRPTTIVCCHITWHNLSRLWIPIVHLVIFTICFICICILYFHLLSRLTWIPINERISLEHGSYYHLANLHTTHLTNMKYLCIDKMLFTVYTYLVDDWSYCCYS